jgi:5-methylcytosine-specific restriction endonuclease McrA
MGKSNAYQWFLESSVAPKEQRIFVRKQFNELKKQYEFWDYLSLVFKKYQHRRCYYCAAKLYVTPHRAYKGEKRDWEIDHKVAIYYGGTNVPKNLCIACKPCNREKGADLMERNIKTLELSKKMQKKKLEADKAYF